MNVTLPALQLEKPSSSIICELQGIELYPGPNLQTQTPTLSSQWGPGRPAPLCQLGFNRPTGQSGSSFNRLSFELLNFQISLAPLEKTLRVFVTTEK